MSVPKILTLFIPEILSHPAKAGKDRTLPMPPVGGPGRREEDVRNVKASRSRDSVEGWSPQDRSGSFGGSFPFFGEANGEKTPVVEFEYGGGGEEKQIGRPSLVENFRKLIVAILE